MALSPRDTSRCLSELQAELHSHSRTHLSRRGNESDRHRPDSWRRNSYGPCSGSQLRRRRSIYQSNKTTKIELSTFVFETKKPPKNCPSQPTTHLCKGNFSHTSHQIHQGSLSFHHRTELAWCIKKKQDTELKGCCRTAWQKAWWVQEIH